MRENELYHYGVKGMKWGVRRYQNKDGTLTEEGKRHAVSRTRTINAGKTKDDVDSIISTMNKDDIAKLAAEDGYLSYEQGSFVAKRILEKDGDTPIAFFDVFDDGDSFNLAVGVRNEKKYRGKGYGAKVAQKGVEWMEKNADRLGKTKAVWGVRVDNTASIRIAEKNGFKLDRSSYSNDRTWVNYEKKFNRR